MGHALAQVTLPNVSGVSEDVAVNTFHFSTPGAGVSVADVAIIAGKLEGFYNLVHPPGSSPLGDELSPHINRAGCRIKVYDMGQPKPRIPVYDGGFVLTPTGASSGFPNEVALVTSFRADYAPGVPRGRLRGRVYLGPLAMGNQVSSSGDVRPGQATINKVHGASKWLADNNADAIFWSVYSPRLAGLGQISLRAVVAGWVDNAYDTQRRRGKDASTRVNWVIGLS